MRILVTASTIMEYGLDKLTGNSKEDLLARVEEMKVSGYDMYVNLPDAEGGDTEAPNERNVFEHFSDDLPEPDGATHSQDSVNLSDQVHIYVDTDCHYVKVEMFTGRVKWICRAHGVESKHDLEAHPNAPCISVDPLGSHIWE